PPGGPTGGTPVEKSPNGLMEMPMGLEGPSRPQEEQMKLDSPEAPSNRPVSQMETPPAGPGGVETFQMGAGGGTKVERNGMAARKFESNELDRLDKMELLKRLERLEKLLTMAHSAGFGNTATLGGMRMDDLGGFAPRMHGMKGFKVG